MKSDTVLKIVLLMTMLSLELMLILMNLALYVLIVHSSSVAVSTIFVACI